MRIAIVAVFVSSLLFAAAPAAADGGTYSCTVLAGTQTGETLGVQAQVSATTPAGGLGECHLHTLQGASRLATASPSDGCSIQVDTDEDGFADGTAKTDRVYEEGQAFFAFCQLGVSLAENEIELVSAS